MNDYAASLTTSRNRTEPLVLLQVKMVPGKTFMRKFIGLQ